MIKLDATYSDYVNTTDPKYPAGKAVDASGEESTDGTPLLAKWMNDINGTRQAIIKEAFGDMSGVSGVPDDSESSDVLKALKKITQDYTNSKVEDEAQTREQGDSSTLGSAKSYIDQKFIKHYEKGYLQMPGMPSPLEDTSMHYEGYSWYEVNYDGNFFRAKGRNAKAFSSKKLTKENIENGAYIFQDNEQWDAIRNISGFFEIYTYDGWNNFDDGKLFKVGRGRGDGESSRFAGKNVRVDFDASKAEGVSVAEENRPRNLTFIYWVLIKNE